MVYLFPNDDNNFWINKYNDLVIKIKSQESINIERKKNQKKRNDKSGGEYLAENIGIHHIIPKSLRPDLVKNKDNFLYVNFIDHMLLHYYLWKADPIYASQLWFGCVYGRKHKLWDLPGGEEDYKQLKEDLKLNKKKKKENI